MTGQSYSWTEFLTMDEPTLANFVEQGDGIPFVQQSMARRALSEVRRRAWSEMQRQYSALEGQASSPVEDQPQSNGHASIDAVPMDARAALSVDDPMNRALALSQEAMSTAHDAQASALISNALIERQNQRIRWANMISVVAVLLALVGMWRS